MKKITGFLFSYRLMALLLAVFAISIAAATFIENDFGTETARKLVYNAHWFEGMLILGIINLSGIIFLNKMYRKGKVTIFLFHFAFLLILVGAGITRFFGYEGVMHIREGQSSNSILTADNYFKVMAITGTDTAYREQPVIFSAIGPNKLNTQLDLPESKVKITLTKYIPSAKEVVIEDKNGVPVIELMIAGQGGSRQVSLAYGDSREVMGQYITFGDSPLVSGNSINIGLSGNNLIIKASSPIVQMQMSSRNQDTLNAGKAHPFYLRTLYSVNSVQLVARSYLPRGQVELTSGTGKQGSGFDAVKLNIASGRNQKDIILWKQDGTMGDPVSLSLGATRITLAIGGKLIHLPFSIFLNNFIMQRYPGSNSPSWFESEVTLIDQQRNVKEDHRIYMNNILNYRGFRFYQSSFDQDEKGTILSVNHDLWGTIVTYTGYLLLAIGMFLSLLNKNSRFRKLARGLSGESGGVVRNTVMMVFLIFMLTSIVQAQPSVPEINKKKAESFGKLLVQEQGGRITPLNTLASEFLRKVSRKLNYQELNPDQVVLGILAFPDTFNRVPLIRVSNPQLQEMIGITGEYASFNDFFTDGDHPDYKLSAAVDEAFRKKPVYRNKYDDEVIRVDERLNITYALFSGDLLRIFPRPGDPSQKWYDPVNGPVHFTGKDSLFVASIFPMYVQEVRKGMKTGDWGEADEFLEAMKKYQEKFGAAVIPSKTHQQLELLYNKANIFDRLSGFYALIGFILLIMQFVALFYSRLNLRPAILVTRILIIAAFVFHFAGLAMRWYIAGHAPWSNGYESLIYIAFVTVLAGIIFSRKSGITLSATALLAALTLFVAHLSWMDPQITNLVPVLKSYWLVIHVAVITASYGFLALGALLALINLMLMIFRTERNYSLISSQISNLSSILEMTLIIGLYLVTIGTFLGGVWANESWGRYWGWDPKETWALVTVLVYAFIAHMRMVPGLRGNYLFNLMGALGFSSVIMTYFGVNYYLSGMHSYAKGDPVPVPDFVYYTVGIIAVIALLALIRNYYVKKNHIEPKV